MNEECIYICKECKKEFEIFAGASRIIGVVFDIVKYCIVCGDLVDVEHKDRPCNCGCGSIWDTMKTVADKVLHGEMGAFGTCPHCGAAVEPDYVR